MNWCNCIQPRLDMTNWCSCKCNSPSYRFVEHPSHLCLVESKTDRPYHSFSLDLSKNHPLIEVVKQSSKCASLLCNFPWELSLVPSITVVGQCFLAREPSRGKPRPNLMEELVDVDINLLRFLLCIRKHTKIRCERSSRNCLPFCTVLWSWERG